MSHFTVLVIGPDHEKQLQPFHEFECTGTNDEFVKDVDETADKRDEFASDTRTVVKMPSGEIVSAYDERFYRPARPGEEHSGGRYGKVRELPAGLVPYEARFESVADWADYNGSKVLRPGEEPDLEGDHKFGYVRVDDAGQIVNAVDRTNPNAKWDWWTVGGRWSGFLKLKPGAEGSVGEPGVMGSRFASGDDRADQARKGDIDFAGMRDQAGDKAAALWDKANAITGGQSWDSWEKVRETVKPIEAAREFYHQQPAVAALKAGDREAFGWDLDDALAGTREAYVQTARNKALSTFAVLSRGEWTERGRMGWFACVSDEMDRGRWDQLFNDMLDGLPDDTLLTIVDCHI